MSKVIIIGGGASGLIAALKASEKNEVILLEKNDKCGKKILLTGNGKCNYWHDNINTDNYYTDDVSNLENILEYRDEVFNYLTNLGIHPRIKNGYYYPNSNQAASIKEIFERELEYRNIKVLYNFEVKDIQKENDYFKIISDKETLTCDKVILASGSKAYPKTGSDGFAYEVLRKFNLKINPVLPSLTSLKCKENYLKDWSGIRTDVRLSLYINNEKIREDEGELQLTDEGISGICTFNISGYASRALNGKKEVQVKINFAPYIDNFKTFLDKRNNLKSNYKITEILESVFNYKLILVIMKKANINVNARWNDLTKEDKNRLIDNFTNFLVNITEVGSFNNAQVCTGGVSLNEINSSNMESQKISNLYLIGEMLDVDGICGGYNLAFAFITGYIAGKEV